MKISEHFRAEEFIPPPVFDRYGERSIWFIDERIVLAAEWLRRYTGRPMTVNNYHAGGTRRASGYRLKPIGSATMSQHLFGRAFDSLTEGMTAEEMRQIVRDNFLTLHTMFGVAAIEKDVDWLHLDCRSTLKSILMEF